MTNEEIQKIVMKSEKEYEELKDTLHDQYNEIQDLKQKNEELAEELKEWKHRYKSQCSKMGAYKQKVAKEVREREKKVGIKEWKLEDREREITRKENFLETTDYESLSNLKHEILEDKRINREQLRKDFEKAKENIINELSDELIRWTEANDIDNPRSQGYVIGINKAKKIIRENMNFHLETEIRELSEFFKKGGEFR